MKLLMICHMAVPHHNAGGETTIHAAFRELVKRGHEVFVACRPHTNEIQFEDYVYEGVCVVRPPWNADAYTWFSQYVQQINPDLLLTHLDLTPVAEQLSLDTDLPLAHFVHNDIKPGFHRVYPNKCQLAIHNSEWVARSFDYKKVPFVVVHPVIELERYRCERGTKITFINPTPDKGADTFYALSKALPHREFLVVKSVYGEQIAPPNIKAENFPNVEVMEHTSDIREAFRKSRVVLMPSIYESYGRVAVEAACAGIPAIVHPTEGLLEALGAEDEQAIGFARHSLEEHRGRRKWETPEQFKGGWVGGAGIFCDRNDTESWAGQIERLYTDDVYYRSRSDAALKLAESLDPEGEFDRLEEALLVTASQWQQREKDGMQRMWTANRRLYYDAEKNITDDPAKAISLCCGIGGQIPEEDAIRLGFIESPTVGPQPVATEKTESLLDTKALTAPSENKAIQQPDAIKKRGRKKKDEIAA